MGTPNKDEVEGKWDQAKGAVKENVGRAINDTEMETEGQADRSRGTSGRLWHGPSQGRRDHRRHRDDHQA